MDLTFLLRFVPLFGRLNMIEMTNIAIVLSTLLYCTVDAVNYDTVDNNIRYLSEEAAFQSLRRFTSSNECKKDIETILTTIDKTTTNASLFWTKEKKRNFAKGFASGPFVRFG